MPSRRPRVQTPPNGWLERGQLGNAIGQDLDAVRVQRADRRVEREARHVAADFDMWIDAETGPRQQRWGREGGRIEHGLVLVQVVVGERGRGEGERGAEQRTEHGHQVGGEGRTGLRFYRVAAHETDRVADSHFRVQLRVG